MVVNKLPDGHLELLTDISPGSRQLAAMVLNQCSSAECSVQVNVVLNPGAPGNTSLGHDTLNTSNLRSKSAAPRYRSAWPICIDALHACDKALHVRSNRNRDGGTYPRYGLMSGPTFCARSARICIVDSEILKLASSPRMARNLNSLDKVGSSTSLSDTFCKAMCSLSTAADLACSFIVNEKSLCRQCIRNYATRTKGRQLLKSSTAAVCPELIQTKATYLPVANLLKIFHNLSRNKSKFHVEAVLTSVGLRAGQGEGPCSSLHM